MTVLNTADNIRLGARQVDRAYLGTVNVWDGMEKRVLAAFASVGAQGGIYKVRPGYCWQDTAGTVPANVNDPVGRLDDISGSGNHIRQATATARPTLLQVGTRYCLGSDVVDDFLASAASLTFGPSSYFAVAGSKAGGSGGLFMVGTSAANRVGLLNVGSVGRFMPYMRVAGSVLSSGAGVVNVWPDDVVAVAESLIVPGTSTGYVNGVQTHNFANTVAAQSIITAPIGLSAFGSNGQTELKRFYGGYAQSADPGSSNRLLVRQWLASLSGVTLP